MENASKALLIAGGVLMTMLVIALLIFAWGKFSDFYRKDEDLSEITSLSEFNLQFTNYENREVYGYELISLANKVTDYNYRLSNAEGAQNDEKYNPINMIIDFNHNRDKFAKYTNNALFTNDKGDIYEINKIKNLIDKSQDLEDAFGTQESATRIAKSIDSLILTTEQLNYNRDYKNMSYEKSKILAIETFNRLSSGQQYTDYQDHVEQTYTEMCNYLKGKGDIMAYYEYYQFKRGVFKCVGITYDDVNGRVSSIKFEFEGRIE